jgi:hypothetical protein
MPYQSKILRASRHATLDRCYICLNVDDHEPGFWKTVFTSTVIATFLSSGLSFYQINLARQDNRTSIRRQTLKDLQGSLVT